MMLNRISLVRSCLIALVFAANAIAGGLNLSTQLVASGFDKPVFVTAPPGDNTRLLVVEQETGRIMLIKNGTRVTKPFLDIDNRVGDGGGEQGLLGLAFHPGYATNRLLFVNFTDNQGNTKIERFKARDDFDSVKRKSREPILRVAQPAPNHNGGMIAFGPSDGYLYIGLGDGGGADDGENYAQRLSELLGKFLRIDVDHGLPYTIPSDNPFVSSANSRDEIWSFGWRNPWRWSFDRETGDLWAGDVGQDAIEEVDFQPADSDGGENYGWKIAEGFSCRGGTGSCGDDPGFTPPVLDYSHFFGTTVVGGYVYRGTAIAPLKGVYFFADYTRARFWILRYDENDVQDFTEITGDLDPPGSARINKPSSFGEDASGELYICDHQDGEIYKIISE